MSEEHELDLVVTSHREIADQVAQLVLQRPDGGELPEWTPGAHLDLIMEPELVRQYSLCGEPTDLTRYKIAVLREPNSRGGSRYVHDHLSDGAVVHMRGPRNHFELDPSPRYLFIGGGIGVTPLVPMVARAVADGADVRIEYGGRSRGSMAYLHELESEYPDRLTVHPQDEVGMIDLDSVLKVPQPDTLIYCCGPEALLQAVEERCSAWPEGALHLERFSPKTFGDPVRSGSFEVVLERTGKTVTVPPDKSVLEMLDEAGVFTVSSCQEGTCGTCEAVVLDGEVDHRDSLLSPAEQAANEVMYPCVSRAKSARLVLDL